MCAEQVLMKIPAHLWENDAVYPEGGEHVVRDGEHFIPVDACIAPSVQALWDAGVVTLASCCGHPEPGGNPWGVITVQTQPGVRQGGAQLVRRERYEALMAAEAALDAERATSARLRAALRLRAVTTTLNGRTCWLCMRSWGRDQPERHGEGCVLGEGGEAP